LAPHAHRAAAQRRSGAWGAIRDDARGGPAMVMDSEGLYLWWVDSWIEGGSLIEGPQVIKREGVYFLFFA
jgi:hypothetical protein